MAVASLDMFKDGLFSSDPSNPFQVDGPALQKLTIDALAKGLQITDMNPIDGLEGRAGVLMRLGGALMAKSTYFGNSARPGNLLGKMITCNRRNPQTNSLQTT